MRTYNFEYTDTKFTLKLLGLSFLALVVMLIAMAFFIDVIGLIGIIILAFAVSFLVFFLNKKKIMKQGSATIYDAYSEFKLSDLTDKITYADIKTYIIDRYKGTQLKIKLSNGKEFTLRANSNFCNPAQFDMFSQDFDKTVQQFKVNNNVALIREKSMFEKAWMLPFLMVLTVALIASITFAISQGKNIPPIFYTSAAIIIPLWIGYVGARKRNRDKKLV